jgi:hypothetical protein
LVALLGELAMEQTRFDVRFGAELVAELKTMGAVNAGDSSVGSEPSRV